MKDIDFFKDETLNKQFLEDGYVKVQLFNEHDCAEIKKMAKKVLVGKMYNQLDFSSLPHEGTTDEECMEIHDFFEKLLNQKITKFMTDHFSFFYSILFAKKTKSSKFMWHVDPSFYNQKNFGVPVSLWAGIDKTTKRNGGLRIVPKSHKLAFDYQSYPLGGLGVAAAERDKNIEKLTEKYAIDINLKKGEVLIHHQALLHASYPNNSYFKKRIAYKVIFMPKNVEHLELSYFNKINNSVDIYKVGKDQASINMSRFLGSEIPSSQVKENELLKSVILDINTLPYSTLSEMEEIMNAPNDSLMAKFELLK